MHSKKIVKFYRQSIIHLQVLRTDPGVTIIVMSPLGMSVPFLKDSWSKGSR